MFFLVYSAALPYSVIFRKFHHDRQRLNACRGLVAMYTVCAENKFLARRLLAIFLVNTKPNNRTPCEVAV